MGVIQNWYDLEKGLKPSTRQYQGTCDQYCQGPKHSPGCALRTLISGGFNIHNAIRDIETSIEMSCMSGYTSLWTSTRRYNPEYASKEETKRYKEAMILLQNAVYEFCDCGAKYDRAGHYYWCSTQEKKK